jgi:hypothetical protein
MDLHAVFASRLEHAQVEDMTAGRDRATGQARQPHDAAVTEAPVTVPAGTPRWWPLAAAVAAIAALVAWLYGPSLRFGLIWDDPIWFRQGLGLSARDLLLGSRAYQFYRPLTLWFFRLWWRPDGTLAIGWLHAVQLGWHLAASLLVLALARQWHLDLVATSLAGLLAAALAFNHQAVAWAAPQQVALTVMLLVVSLSFTRYADLSRGDASVAPGVSRPLAWLALSLAVYAAALLTQEVAVAFAAWPIIVVALRSSGRRALRSALASPALAAAFAVLWWHAPRLAGVTERGFDPTAAAFLAQGPGFVTTRLAPAGWSNRPLWVLALAAMTWMAGAALLIRRDRGRLAAAATCWVALALLPSWAGLHRAYVGVGQRLVYPATPGIALFWAAVAGAVVPKPRRALGVLAAAATLAVLLVAVADVRAEDRPYEVGTRHLAEAVRVLAAAEGRVLFVNFPDRFEMRRPPYPLGYWGVTLAPVVVELADFATAVAGRSAPSASVAVPAVDASDRAAWPYQVDMRGVPCGPAELLVAARSASDVYLTRYLPGGGLELARVGALHPDPGRPALARFAGAAELVEASVTSAAAGRVQLVLSWRLLGTMRPTETVFVHVLGPDGHLVSGADGDVWDGLVPAQAWPWGVLLEDQRAFDPAWTASGTYLLTAGIYDRQSGARRLATRLPSGRRYPDDEAVIAVVTLP